MLRRLAVPLLALALLVTAAGSVAADGPATERGAPAESVLAGGRYPTESAGPAVSDAVVNSCDDLRSDAVQVAQDIPDLNAPGPRGRPHLCLLYHRFEDIYEGYVLPGDSVQQFRDAKSDALQQLQSAGFNVCSIGSWNFSTQSAVRLTVDDELNQPLQCAPRVVAAAGDPGAAAKIPEARTALDRAISATRDQLGYGPNRGLTIIVLTDLQVARDYYTRDTNLAAGFADSGRAVSIRQSLYVGLILLNLVRGGTILDVIFHEYTHFAQGGISGSNDFNPKWFIEGQAEYQQERDTYEAGDLYEAVLLESQGDSLRLRDISTPADFNAHDQNPNEGSIFTYSKGYAAVAYLVETYGFEATVRLLRDNHNGSQQHFNDLLRTLTGQDLDTFDRTVGAWLLGHAAFSGTDSSGSLQVEFVLSSDGARGDGRLRITSELACNNGGGTVKTSAIRFNAPLGAGGDYSLTLGNATLGIHPGNAGEAQASFRYVNAATQCDTGPITARTARVS